MRAVLDVIITSQLVHDHPGLSPGIATDVRAASLNNDRLARLLLAANLEPHIRHSSSRLHQDITEFRDACRAGASSWVRAAGVVLRATMITRHYPSRVSKKS